VRRIHQTGRRTGLDRALRLFHCDFRAFERDTGDDRDLS
jgi:hypothetical protein